MNRIPAALAALFTLAALMGCTADQSADQPLIIECMGFGGGVAECSSGSVIDAPVVVEGTW